VCVRNTKTRSLQLENASHDIRAQLGPRPRCSFIFSTQHSVIALASWCIGVITLVSTRVMYPLLTPRRSCKWPSYFVASVGLASSHLYWIWCICTLSRSIDVVCRSTSFVRSFDEGWGGACRFEFLSVGTNNFAFFQVMDWTRVGQDLFRDLCYAPHKRRRKVFVRQARALYITVR
jgi:hypothetical protein